MEASASILPESATEQGPAAPPPALLHAFSLEVKVGAAVELGEADGGLRRFIPIHGGRVFGPRLRGRILAAGGDWQTILPGGLSRIEARYFLEAVDGTIIEIVNPGLRIASEAVTERMARGEAVPPDTYYFRTTPTFTVRPGQHDWLERTVFVARGTRWPERVLIDFYAVT